MYIEINNHVVNKLTTLNDVNVLYTVPVLYTVILQYDFYLLSGEE